VKVGGLGSYDSVQLNNTPDISEVGVQASKFKKTADSGDFNKIHYGCSPSICF
jgi:hypothetical protein